MVWYGMVWYGMAGSEEVVANTSVPYVATTVRNDQVATTGSSCKTLQNTDLIKNNHKNSKKANLS